MDDFPCSHAAAALYRRKLKPFDFVPSYYTSQNYAAIYAQDIVPIEDLGEWDLPEDAHVINPPVYKRQAGRPKMKRYRSKSELFHPYRQRCSKCGNQGHNKRGCKSSNDL